MHVQPIEVQPATRELHVTASGIPEKITLTSEAKAIPLDIRWPKDPLNISIGLRNGSAASKDNESQKVIDTFSQLNREYKEQLSDLNKKNADAEQREKNLRQNIDNLKLVLDERKKAEQKIREEAQQQREKLEEKHARGMPEPEYQRRLKDIGEDTAKKISHVAEDATRTMINDARREIFYIVMFGALGGVSSVMIDWAKRKQQAKAKVGTKTPEAATTQSDSDDRSKKDTGMGGLVSELTTGILLGTVAALIVPIGLLFIPGVNLQTASHDPFTFVTLCSLCFAVGMIGEPFIEFVLDRLRSLTTKNERTTQPALSGETPTSPTASQTTGSEPGRDSTRNPLWEALSAMSGGASLIMGWALAIFGATAVGLISGKYLHPTAAFRYVYLLFLPGWLFLAVSIFYGEKVTRRLTAGAFAKDNDERLLQIAEAMNTDYDKQRWYFQLSLLTFGAWLLCLLIWWVLAGDISIGKTIGFA